MPDLLQEIPGVVVLHDFYLSNLGFIQEFIRSQENAFINSLEGSHGLRGSIDYLCTDIQKAREDWPVNWQALKYAQEIIIHSSFQKELLQHYYKRGWLPNPVLINQLRRGEKKPSLSEKKEGKSRLSLDPEVFLFSSFGHTAQQKQITRFCRDLSRC